MNHHRGFVRILALMTIFAFISPVLTSAQTYSTRTTDVGTNVSPSNVPTSGDADLDWIIFRAGEAQGVDPRFIHAVITQESHYKSDAKKWGLMQLMPATAKRFGYDDPDYSAANIKAGTKYLEWLLKRFDGNVALALAGYNADNGVFDKQKDGHPMIR